MKKDYWRNLYREDLKTSEWQELAAKIKLRDGCTCTRCGARDTTFDVHHIEYHPGKRAFEYDEKYLRLLCRRCHEINHDIPPVTILIDHVLGPEVPKPKEWEIIMNQIQLLTNKLKTATDIEPILIELRDLNHIKVELAKELGYTPTVNYGQGKNYSE
jgi:hypothetical protein